MLSSLFPEGLIGSLGFLWHSGNVKCYISAKYHYLELPPSPQHVGAADAGEKWPAGKTPGKMNAHGYPEISLGRCPSSKKGIQKSFPPSSQRQEQYLIQDVLPSARTARVQSHAGVIHPSERYSSPADSTGKGLLPASGALSQICGSSQSHLQTPNQNNRSVSLSSSLNHHHTCISPG